jgi:hypothetical protein
MIKTMIGIKIEELTASGFVELLVIDVEKPEEWVEDNIEKQNESIAEMTKLLYDGDKFHMSIESGVGICIRGIKTKTFRVSRVLK